MEYQYNIELNEYLSTPEKLNLSSYPEEILELFWDFVMNVPYIRRLIAKDRPHAKDLPRDNTGKIIFDICNPPILDDMDYFRPSAIHYLKYGCYTKLRPNKNPNSEYAKWLREEIRRCYKGYIRPSDGMWVTGDMYWFLNYWPIAQTKLKEGSKKGERVVDFPEVWEGINSRYQYIELAANGGKYSIPNTDGNVGGDNGSEISSRAKSKSYTMSAMMGKRFILGESEEVNTFVKSMAIAYQKLYLTSDGILNKFVAGIDFLSLNTEFPRKRIKTSLQDMNWVMGYTDVDTGARKGTLNEVIGVSAKDDIAKARGKRMNFIVVEEFGSFRGVMELYQVMLPSVQEGDYSFGQMYLIGTAGDDDADFAGALELIYNPKGYRMYALPNVFDKEGCGKNQITFFFPGYINRKGCYDKNGNSDVTKAILEILIDRYRVKYNSTDVNAITKTIAEIPIVPQEALLRTRGNIFPVSALNERLNLIDSNPNSFSDVYTGDLVLTGNGEVEFKLTYDTPIRDFPLKDNTAMGCFEIFLMPEKDSSGKVKPYRYIASLDPYRNDQAESSSLGSFFVLDLLSDKIVCEYTGRTPYLDDFFEKVRLACIFYNAKCLYESNIRGCFAYFSKMNSLHLLADTPEYLRDKQIIKYSSFGSSSKGVSASKTINNYEDNLIRDWLLKPVLTTVVEGEEEKEITVPNLYFIRNRALLKELLLYNPIGNYDRVRSLGILMLYREEKMILYLGNITEEEPVKEDPNDFFTLNYDLKFGNNNREEDNW